VDALQMMQAAAVLLGITAIGGIVMAIMRFRGAERPPTWILMAHGLLAASALTLLIYAAAVFGLPTLAMAATVIFVVVAIVGGWLNLNYHSKQLPIPKTPIVVHGLAAVLGYVLLLLSVMA
jgi:hypothetical protein